VSKQRVRQLLLQEMFSLLTPSDAQLLLQSRQDLHACVPLRGALACSSPMYALESVHMDYGIQEIVVFLR
jgi:hypothetical protein